MRIWLAIAVGTLAELSGVALTATATWLIMRAAEQPPLHALTIAIVAVRALALARGGLRYLERLTGHNAVLRHAVELRGRVYDSLVRRKDIPSGEALTRIVSDVDARMDALLRGVLPAVVAALVSVTAIAVSGFSLPLVAGLLVTVLVLPATSAWSARRRDRACAPLRAELADHAVGLVHGREELVAFGDFAAAVAKAERTAEALARKERVLDLVPVAVLAQFGAALLMLAHGEPAWLVLGAIAVFEVTVPLANLRLPAKDTSAPDDAPTITPDFPLAGRTAVIGPTGAGKTTLLNSIARELEPCKGALADAHVFHTTVKANVLLAKPHATQEELDEAKRVADLDLDWDTVVGERGEEISGGQRQRLILTRSVLADPEVLLLDEPTEGLDPEHAVRVLANVLDHSRGTAVVVTHRLEQLRLFDHVHHRGPVGHEDVRRIRQPLVTDLHELGQRSG